MVSTLDPAPSCGSSLARAQVAYGRPVPEAVVREWRQRERQPGLAAGQGGELGGGQESSQERDPADWGSAAAGSAAVGGEAREVEVGRVGVPASGSPPSAAARGGAPAGGSSGEDPEKEGRVIIAT